MEEPNVEQAYGKTSLDIGPFRTPNKVFELILQTCHNRRFDRDKERAFVLEDDGEGVFHFAFDSSQNSQEASYRLGLAEEKQSLVDRMRSCEEISTGKLLAISFLSEPTEPKQNPRARCVRFLRKQIDPRWPFKIIMDFYLRNSTKRILLHQML